MDLREFIELVQKKLMNAKQQQLNILYNGNIKNSLEDRDAFNQLEGEQDALKDILNLIYYINKFGIGGKK